MIFTFGSVIIIDLQLRREGKYAQDKKTTDRISLDQDSRETEEDFKQNRLTGAPLSNRQLITHFRI